MTIDFRGRGSAAGRDLATELMARAAHQYFILGLTQNEVAKNMAITRFKAHRLIAAARERGLVRIHIDIPSASRLELERKLSLKYGLEPVMVTPSDCTDYISLSEVIGHSAASLAGKIVDDHTTLAVSWGITLRALANAVEPAEHENLSIVPMLGSLTRRSSIDRYDAATPLARKLGAECYYLPGPIFCDTRENAEAIHSQPVLRETLERAARADMALLSVGGADFNTIVQTGLLDSKALNAAEKAGAIGNFLGRFLDERGNELSIEQNENCIALPLDAAIRIPNRLLIAGGETKLKIMHAIICRGYATGLVTDERTAISLIDR